MKIGVLPAPKNNERYQDIGVIISGTRNIFHPEETDIIVIAENLSDSKTIVTLKTNTSSIAMIYSLLLDYNNAKDISIFNKFNAQIHTCQYGIIKDGVKTSGLGNWALFYDTKLNAPIICITNNNDKYLAGLALNEKTKLELIMLYCNIMKINILDLIGSIL